MENLTLMEAYTQSKSGDYIANDFMQITPFLRDNFDKYSLTFVAAIDGNWRIIKKKQEPISAEKIINDMFDQYKVDGNSNAVYKAIEKSVILSSKNERIVYADLMELFEKYIDAWPTIFKTDIQEALQKIKQHQDSE